MFFLKDISSILIFIIENILISNNIYRGNSSLFSGDMCATICDTMSELFCYYYLLLSFFVFFFRIIFSAKNSFFFFFSIRRKKIRKHLVRGFYNNYGSTQTYTKLKIYNRQTPKYSKGIWE